MINFSFIIPHKNTPELLKRCVDSIPIRDDVEIIVVDDNSEQEFIPRINRLGLKLIHLDSFDSKGAGHARNVGLSAAEGKWIFFADADDSYSKEIDVLLDKFCDIDVDVLYFNYTYFSGVKTINNACDYISEKKGTDVVGLKFNVTVPWNKMIRLDFLKKHSTFFEECPVGNDILFTYQVGYYSGDRFYVLNKDIYNYYVNQGSIIHKKKNDDKHYLTICKHIYQRNAFFRFIQNKQYVRSMFSKLLAVCFNKGLSQSFRMLKVFIMHHKEIVEDENYFVEVIRSNCLK